MTQAVATVGAATLTAAAAKAQDAQRVVGTSLDATLQPYLSRFTLPALAAAVVRQGDLAQPSQDFAMVLMTNVGGTKAEQALGELTEALYRQHGPSPG
jgi:hypothetical protein